MNAGTWAPLSKIQDLLVNVAWENVAAKVDSFLSAGLEAVADVLPTATATTLRQGAASARTAFETLVSKESVDEESAAFAAGRLAAAVDILGYAAHQTADDAVLTIATRQPYATLLEALHDKPMRNVDLAERLGKDKGQISKLLATLREHQAVTSHRQGREVFNALSPVGRLVVERGIEERVRAPIGQSRVFDIAAAANDMYSLRGREGLADARPSAPVRISASL
jgi:DNA-binding transcriptional ArsR family regulator